MRRTPFSIQRRSSAVPVSKSQGLSKRRKWRQPLGDLSVSSSFSKAGDQEERGEDSFWLSTMEEAHLPVELLRCQLVPPAPNVTPNSIGWLRDFAGFSWLAYGAASLAIITHTASPLSHREAVVGSFFHQVLEPDPPPGHADSSIFTVRALSWCPSVPSDGTLAVALGSSISLYSPLPDCLTGLSFRWRLVCRFVQYCQVEAIEWTRSGDGLITAGSEVVAWKKKDTGWEVLWKSHPELPQTLVSAAWSVHGTAATAAPVVSLFSLPVGNSCIYENETRKAMLWQSNKRSGLVKAELNHPQPVSMIQWRPLCLGKASPVLREVLLTCCMDGVVRLWTEIGQGRGRKYTNGIIDQKLNKPQFYVSAVIEINQWLGGCLGTDTFIKWTHEITAVDDKGEKVIHCHREEGLDCDVARRCEWLVVVGPGTSIAFWAVHYLDDISPLRCPRLHLWKKINVSEFNRTCTYVPNASNFQTSLVFVTTYISRSRHSNPPTSCSLLQLLPDSSFMWLHLDRLWPNVAVQVSLDQLSKDSSASISCKLLNLDGHSSSIVQLAMHPCRFEIDLAASLDSNGHILLWSLSSSSNFYPSKPTSFQPAWKCKGIILGYDECLGKYSSLAWAPVLSNGNILLLVGHAGGIDCLIIEVTSNARFEHHKVCTVSFSDHIMKKGPDHIHTCPLPSIHSNNGTCTSFMLIGVWMGVFQVLAWRFVVHLHELVGDYCSGNATSDKVCAYEFGISGANYCIDVGHCSSRFPGHDESDTVTSIDVVHSGASAPAALQTEDSLVGCIDGAPIYHMATGCSDGTLRLYRILHIAGSFCLPWQLVGTFRAHDGAVNLISLSSGSGKIATAHMRVVDACSCLRIWDSVNVMDEGCFILEDEIYFNDSITALNFVIIGNGLSFLGVGLPNKLCIYAQKRCDDWNPIKSEFSLKMQNWLCIAHISTSQAINNFMWGPKLSLVLLHEKYIGIASQWSLATDGECQADFHPEYFMDQPADLRKTTYREYHHHHCSSTKRGMHSILDIMEKWCGSLPLYHPKALLSSLFSGNWRRAYAAVEHLVTWLDGEGTSNIHGRSDKIVKSSHSVHQVKLSKYFQENCSSSMYHVEPHSQKNFLQFLNTNSASIPSAHDDGFFAHSGESEIKRFSMILENSPHIPCITSMEGSQILALLDLLKEINDGSGAMSYERFDEPARRFWVAVRLEKLHFYQKFGRAALVEELVVDSSLIAWAFQSDCHENLLISVLSSEPSWLEMRNLGVGFWYTNMTMLRGRMENLARAQYLKNKDPKDCALLYLALNRIKVLAGLFKVSKDEKDKPLFGFLSRNFQEEKNKAAALKNAFVLMGRHQLELAVAFFLLGGDHSSAVAVCAKNLGDVQLALVICRLLEGYGGQLERDLIANHILPSSIAKGDYWLASILEWIMGHYSQSCLCLLNGVSLDSNAMKLDVQTIHHAASDPNIGQYCAILASQSNVRNLLGDANAAMLARWAMMMASLALARCGLPLQALDCISSWSNLGGKMQGLISCSRRFDTLYGILRPNLQTDSYNWLSGDVAPRLLSCVRLGLAMQCTSKFIIEHLFWENACLTYPSIQDSLDFMTHHYEELIGALYKKLQDGILTLETKYSINTSRMLNMILVFACNNGKLFLGHQIMNTYISSVHLSHKLHGTKKFIHHSFTPKAMIHVTKEICYDFARCVVACGVMASVMKIDVRETALYGNTECWSSWDYHLNDFLQSISCLKLLLRFLIDSSMEMGFGLKISSDLDHLRLCICFAFAWLRRNSELLLQLIQSILGKFNLIAMNSVNQSSQVIFHEDSFGSSVKFHKTEHNQLLYVHHQLVASIFPNDERWQLLGACLWQKLFIFTSSELCMEVHNEENLLNSPPRSESFFHLDSEKDEINGISIVEQMESFPLFVLEALINAISYIFCGLTRELIFFLAEKLERDMAVVTLTWLHDMALILSKVPAHLDQGESDPSKRKHDEITLSFEHLWEIIVKPDDVCNVFVHEGIKCFKTVSSTHSKGWGSVQEGIMDEVGRGNASIMIDDASGSTDTGHDKHYPSGSKTHQGCVQTSSSLVRDGLNVCFHDKEILRRHGELLEAICVNSCDEKQVAVASNRKGLFFFRWGLKESSSENMEYIWSELDWPQNGRARSESTPVPTFVSTGVGLCNQNGTHLGLGGATVVLSSLARPGRDLTGGGAFGIPGYAGIGASGVGWGEQEDFEEFVDPLATVENISTRAISSHPSRPLFLVGSGNTHIYLWEFGKKTATETYGILPAANVPPPYALASISALRFDHCGHRFASTALDGTVCTWQLEVGGRSNVQPIESSFCFHSYASDVTYLGSSGSILVAAGSSPSNANVVVWDTLAPAATSRISLQCHEGGAQSVAVFDHDLGSGSISPLIITGGKGGDVGVHDFRFITTGKSRRHQIFKERNFNLSRTLDTDSGPSMKFGDENSNGMLWYLPKAHLGSITSISAITNTSLFLTGSKDGDVKLWDAKRSELLFHWPKMHDRHAFLQPNSRGFNGFVRAAVTDIQVISGGFLTCGGDGVIKLVHFRNL